MTSRRRFTVLAAATTLGAATHRARARADAPDPGAIEARLREIEGRAKGRLGVHVLDTGSGRELGHRADERFLMLSSFKLLASAFVLHRADLGQESLNRRIRYGRGDLVEWSPVTERHVGGDGLSLAALCEATMTTSDNTAANLILASFGGPPALTAWLRRLSDSVTRLDRVEPELNVAARGEPLDTTSPRAMARTVARLVLGDALSPGSRQRLQRWLLDNTTGGKRLRAGVPGDWRVGEKTGTNRTSANDVGVAWPPGRAPLVVSAYLADSAASGEAREAALAAVGGLLAEIAA